MKTLVLLALAAAFTAAHADFYDFLEERLISINSSASYQICVEGNESPDLYRILADVQLAREEIQVLREREARESHNE